LRINETVFKFQALFERMSYVANTSIAQWEAQLEPVRAGLQIAPASRVRGGGRVTAQEERCSLLDGALHVQVALFGRNAGQRQQLPTG
jgi:hypothetical protein